MQMFQSASLKLGLDYAVMHNTSQNAQAMAKGVLNSPSKPIAKQQLPPAESVSLSNKEIEGLLKHGAYDMFREEKEGISEQVSTNFNDADIDSILARSTVILHDNAGGAATKTLSKKLPNFSTASFVSSGDQTVDVDDPDFWTKVVGLTVDEDEVVALGKRKCREKSFINYADNGFNFKTSMYQDGDSVSEAGGSDFDHGSESGDDAAHVFESDAVNDGVGGEEASNVNKSKSSSMGQQQQQQQQQQQKQQQQRRGHGAKVKAKAKPLLAADWSVENVTKLATTLVETGYGNWEKIRLRSRLHYSLYDIALGK
jgi:hypothetical protein